MDLWTKFEVCLPLVYPSTTYINTSLHLSHFVCYPSRLHILSVHTPDNLKPYQCQICVPPRGFATKWNLFEHMNKHTNERPFKCRNCPSAFATTSSRCHHEKSCGGAKNLRVLK